MNGVEITDYIKKRIEEVAKDAVEKMSKETERMTRRNFNEFAPQVSSDNQRVNVSRIKISDKTQQIVCKGDQVIFIEFGVGVENQYRTSTVKLDETGIKFVEEAPRPAGVVRLGRYGKGLGKLDYWVRPAQTIQRSAGETAVLDRHGNERQGVAWTQGHRPARALYRGYRNALGKLLGGKLK